MDDAIIVYSLPKGDLTIIYKSAIQKRCKFAGLNTSKECGQYF